MYIPIGYLIACALQCIINYYRILTIPITLLNMTGAFLWGLVLKQDVPTFVTETTNLLSFPPRNFMFLYLVITTFGVAFCSDPKTFRKCLGQILIIAVPICLLTAACTGTMSKLLIANAWQMDVGILFGILCCPTHSVFVVRVIKTLSTKSKYVDVILDGEALISTSMMMIVNTLIMANINGYTKHWYQFVLVTLRLLLTGLVCGYCFGKMGVCAIKHVYDSVYCVVVIISSFAFLAFYTTQAYLGGDGVLATLLAGLIMGNRRKLLPQKMDAKLITTWKTISFGVEFAMASYISIATAMVAMKYIPWTQIIKSFVIYSIYYFSRFACFILFFPILKRFKTGMDFRSLLLCVWCGIKNPMMPTVVVINFQYNTLPIDTAHILYFHIVCLIYLSYLLNATLSSIVLRYLGLTEISRTRQLNMNNCMKHIFAKRESVISMLKRDRFLGDTNWFMADLATDMKHPFKVTNNNAEEEEDETFSVGYRHTICPDCEQELTGTLTSKELAEIKKETQMRILKIKKISYSQQYERGMVSKKGAGILITAVELAIESDQPTMNLNFRKQFQHENYWHRFIKKRAKSVEEYKITVFRPPRRYIRRLCYYLVTNKIFDYFMYAVVILNMIPITIDSVYHSSWHHKATPTVKLLYILLAINATFYLFYLAEFIMKILAFSWIHLRQGLTAYFSSNWNILDFILLCFYTVDLLLQIFRILLMEVTEDISHSLWILSLTTEMTRFLRLLRLLRICSTVYPKTIRFLDKLANSKLAIVYEIGKSYADGETEVLELLPYIVEHAGIREELRHEIDETRVSIVKSLGLVQKDRPWVAITVKTKQAIRTVLGSMKEAINQLKILGWTNEFEQQLLTKELATLYRQVNNIKIVDPSAPKIIFKEVLWMAHDEKIIEFLFDHVTVKKFEPDDVVMNEGIVADGIYIVVTGLLRLSYSPDVTVLSELQNLGRLPIVDYISSTQYQEILVDYIVSGNCVGELSILTGRPYNCIITAVTHTQVYVLSQAVMRKAMLLSPDPVNGLECRMWRAESIRVALPILMAVPAYHSLHQEQIKYTLERAFLPNLENFKTFVVNDMIQDIILIEGMVLDFNTRDTLIAPRHIPRTVQKLLLSSSSLTDFEAPLKTKLLIIPETNVDAIDVMLMAEETCQMVQPRSASICLQQISKERLWRLQKIRDTMAQQKKMEVATESQEESPVATGGSLFTKNALDEQSLQENGKSIPKENLEDDKSKKDNHSFHFI